MITHLLLCATFCACVGEAQQDTTTLRTSPKPRPPAEAVANGVAGSPDSLARQERAFAALSVEKGMKKAFLSFLAEDAVLFRPGPVDGRTAVRAQSADSAFTLDWRPLLVCVSGDGSLGYTTGPWVLTDRSEAGVTTRTGQFVSVWRNEPASGWKVILDLGISHPPGGLVLTEVPAPIFERCGGAHYGGREEGYVSLLERDKEFAAFVQRGGLETALELFAAGDIRLLRPGRTPLVGRDSAVLSAFPAAIRWKAGTGGASGSGDLGFTYGEYDSQARSGESGSYVHIWRRDQPAEWRVVLIIHSPHQ